jgi:hypothetical protein
MRKPFDGDYRVSQLFGANPAMYARFNYKGHNGIDWATPVGTPILSPHAGTVIESREDKDGYGLYVKVENSKEGSVLAHFSKLDVVAGQKVSEGQRLGLSGNTGYSTGPHLHWGYYLMPRDRSNGYGGFIDQSPYISMSGSGGVLYKGYDLSNTDSMKVAVDKLVDILEGKYVSISDHQKIINELDAKSTAMAQSYGKDKTILEEKIRTLEGVIEALQKTEHSWADVADKLQRKLVAILAEFQSDGVSLAVEMDEDILVRAISAHLASIEKAKLDHKLASEALLNASKTVTKLENDVVILKQKLKAKDTSIHSFSALGFTIKIYK